MQWIINSRTVLEPLESVDDLIDVDYQYTNFQDLTRFIDAKKETVGTALTTKYDSAILVNPPIDSALRLKNWAQRNKEMLSDLVVSKTYFKKAPELSLETCKKATLVAGITPFQKNVLVKAKLSFRNISQKFWYLSYPKCFQSTSALRYEEYTCNLCESKQMPEPRCRFEVDVIDNSGIITAFIFGDVAEKLLSYSANEVMEHAEKNIELPLEHVHKELQSKLYLVQIRPMKLKSGDGRQRYTITSYVELHEGQLLGSTTLDSTDKAERSVSTSDSQIKSVGESKGIEETTSSPRAKLSLLGKFLNSDDEDKADGSEFASSVKKKQKLD